MARDITHLEKLETMRRDFVANASHELRTPLNVVSGFLELNPVRAGLVAAASEWQWSSYLPHVGNRPRLPWLNTAALHAYFLGKPGETPADAKRASRQYEKFVTEGTDPQFWGARLKQQIYLGDKEFVVRMQALAPPENLNDREISSPHRRELSPLQD